MLFLNQFSILFLDKAFWMALCSYYEALDLLGNGKVLKSSLESPKMENYREPQRSLAVSTPVLMASADSAGHYRAMLTKLPTEKLNIRAIAFYR